MTQPSPPSRKVRPMLNIHCEIRLITIAILKIAEQNTTDKFFPSLTPNQSLFIAHHHTISYPSTDLHELGKLLKLSNYQVRFFIGSIIWYYSSSLVGLWQRLFVILFTFHGYNFFSMLNCFLPNRVLLDKSKLSQKSKVKWISISPENITCQSVKQIKPQTQKYEAVLIYLHG